MKILGYLKSDLGLNPNILGFNKIDYPSHLKKRGDYIKQAKNKLKNAKIAIEIRVMQTIMKKDSKKNNEISRMR
ncbi:MAG: hypothetical protein CM15mP127_07730 [Gammaproteobacteria bacterium]|nr:MAG: hypothetical protein CM15mP127_07730 [Gammaproteobacteria bacterium]